MKRIFDFFRPNLSPPATVARERLKILLAHERATQGSADLLPELQREILAVIARYFPINEEKVQIKLERGGDVSTLEVNVELPGKHS